MEKIGLVQVGPRDSHVKLRNQRGRTVIAPIDLELARGTLAAILQQPGVTVGEFIDVLQVAFTLQTCSTFLRVRTVFTYSRAESIGSPMLVSNGAYFRRWREWGDWVTPDSTACKRWPRRCGHDPLSSEGRTT
ncbi:MAG: type II toxin-antitoxin system HicA family toxin [Acidimicrobiales bacterium]